MAATLDDLLLVREVEEFLFHEARLLDQRRFEDWMALFTDDGTYWVPMQPDQESPLDVHSIFYDDRKLMEVRIRRLRNPTNYAQMPPSRTHHLIGNVEVEDGNDAPEGLRVRSSLVMLEYRDERQRVFGGLVRHRLRRHAESFKIAEKRVDLVNCDAVHHHMSVPF